jgi:hypothetical protein
MKIQTSLSNLNVLVRVHGCMTSKLGLDLRDSKQLKTEIARMRSSMADLFFSNSEKVIDATSPSRLP